MRIRIIRWLLILLGVGIMSIFRWLLIVGCVGIVAGFICLGTMQSAYLNWDFNNPELAVAGTFLHGVEFLFVRIAPFVFVAFVTGIILTYRKR
ncbi:MAG: hypothetical protein V8T13_01330 [[Ruminococcus] lactaris]